MSYAPGPLPPTAEADVFAIMKEIGVASLSLKDLRNRLQDKYKVDLLAQKDALTAIVTKALAHPDFKKVVTAAAKASEKKSAKPEVVQKAAKVVKPDDYPKGAQTAYFLFMGENRNKIKAENPDLSVGDLGKKMGELYKALPADEVERYAGLAKADKERYETEMAAYLAKGGEKVARQSKGAAKDDKGKKVKDPNMPKRGLSAFFIFSNEKRAEVTKELGNNIGQVGKRMGELWAAVSPEEKARCEDLAAKDKLRFIKECEERGIPVPGSKTSRSE